MFFRYKIHINLTLLANLIFIQFSYAFNYGILQREGLTIYFYYPK
jgi:hypothetical protein